MAAASSRGVSINLNVDASRGVQGFAQIGRGVSDVEQKMGRMAKQARSAGADLNKAFAGGKHLDPFTESVARATGGLGQFSTSLRALPAALGNIAGALGLGGVGLAAGMLAVARSAADTAEQMGKLSQRTGVSVEALSRLAYAARVNGGATDDLESGLQSLGEKMQEASRGGNDSAEMFARLGIAVQRSDGSLRSVDEVFIDLAERLSFMPNGVEKTAIAMALLSGAGEKLIPVLNQGREGLKGLADEADRFGQTISQEAVAKATEFNANLVRLQALAQGVAMEIGNALIPSINALAADFLRARNAGLSFGDALVGIGLSNPMKEPAKHVDDLIKKLDELKVKREQALNAVGGRAEGSAVLPMIDREIELRQKELAYWTAKVKEAEAKSGGDGTAKQRLQIEQDLAAEMTRLEKLRAVEAGLANANILKSDRELQAERIKEARNATNEQLKGTERLRDALRSAWQTSIDAARQARQEADEFFKQASTAARNRNQQADERRNRSVSGPEREASNIRSAADLVDRAETASVFAQNAAIDGRAKAAKGYAEEALSLSKEAADYVNSIGDDRAAARFLERIGAAEKAALLAQGKLREQEGKEQEGVAKAIDGQIQGAESRITSLKAELSKPISINLDITAAEQRIKLLQAELAKLGGAPGAVGGVETPGQGAGTGGLGIDKTTTVDAKTTEAENALGAVKKAVDEIPAEKTVTIKTISETGTPGWSDAASDWNSKQNGFASGGLIRGPGSGTSDSILARLSNGEFVIRQAAVKRYGVELLSRLNRLELPRFADGGLVSSSALNRVSGLIPERPQLAPINISLDGRSFPMQAPVDVRKEILKVFQMTALQHGRR